jgi:DNA-binding protein HU-beta
MGENGASASTVMPKGIVEQLAEGHQVPKKIAQDLLTGMVETVTKHLKQGDRIRINGLGTLEVRQREARKGAQSGHWRDDTDRGQQEGCIPGGQGAERGSLRRPDGSLLLAQALMQPCRLQRHGLLRNSVPQWTSASLEDRRTSKWRVAR